MTRNPPTKTIAHAERLAKHSLPCTARPPGAITKRRYPSMTSICQMRRSSTWQVVMVLLRRKFRRPFVSPEWCVRHQTDSGVAIGIHASS
jgi:hypothetical protein